MRGENVSRHRSSERFDDRVTLPRWARILSFANTIRRTTHRHPELLFNIRNPGRLGNETRVPTDTELYFFVE
jgi:hypothetical protein